MEWRKLIDLLKGHKTYLQTHNFPDPDAVASAFGMQQFLKLFNIDTTICYDGKIDKVSTKKMVEELKIEIFSTEEINNMTEDDYIVTIDGQKYNANFTDLIGDEVACIDHHPTFTQCNYKYADIRIVGACSSLVAEYFVKSRSELDCRTATALMYGLRMDTSSLTRGVTELDIEMFSYLYKYADNSKVTDFYINVMEMADLKAYGAAIENIKVLDKIGFAHIPFDCNDGLIAMISDFVLSLNEVNVSVIYADRDGGYKMSVRSNNPDIHSGKMTSDALEGIGNGGGHAAMAGGIIYKDCPDNVKNNIEENIQSRFLNIIKKDCSCVR